MVFEETAMTKVLVSIAFSIPSQGIIKHAGSPAAPLSSGLLHNGSKSTWRSQSLGLLNSLRRGGMHCLANPNLTEGGTGQLSIHPVFFDPDYFIDIGEKGVDDVRVEMGP
jgi:hypothetical protein